MEPRDYQYPGRKCVCVYVWRLSCGDFMIHNNCDRFRVKNLIEHAAGQTQDETHTHTDTICVFSWAESLYELF